MAIDIENPGDDASRLRTALRLAQGAPGGGVKRRHMRVFAGLDSLSAGGGSPTSSPLPALKTALADRLGNGGLGLQGFDVLSTGFYTSGGSGGGTVTSFISADPSWDSGARSHSMNGRGVEFAGVTGAGCGLDPGVTWDIVRVYFELGTSGTFGIVNTGDGAPGQAVNSSTHELNKIQTVDIAAFAGGTGIAIYSIGGTVTFFMAEFLNADGGVIVNNVGLSGSTLVQHLSLDADYQDQWAKLFRPDVFLLNTGMNDRNSATGAAFSGMVNTYLDRWQDHCEDVLLVRCNQPSDYGTSYLADYTTVLRATAALRGCAFINDEDILGTYAEAVSDGYMSDTVHPSETGNNLRGAAYAAEIL